MIDDKDISVVVQGPIIHKESEVAVDWTKEVCASIRTHLPNAELILSTWINSEVNGIDYDLLIENDDPGNFLSYYNGYDQNPAINNINRQIVSTKEGIRAATRKYVMKLRSDSIVLTTNFLKIYEMYGEREERIATFEPRNPYGIFKGQYSLCDFWFLGTKERMELLWNIPLYDQSPITSRDALGEEYLILCLMKNECGITYDQLKNADTNKKGKEVIDVAYKRLMKNLLLILPARKSGIKCLKYPQLNSFSIVCIRHYVYSHLDWINLQKGNRAIFRVGNIIQIMLGKFWERCRAVRYNI